MKHSKTRSRSEQRKLYNQKKYFIIVILIFTLLLMMFTFSRFRTTINRSSNSEIAALVLEYHPDTDFEFLLSPLHSEEIKEYFFDVRNYDENDVIAGVAMDYTIEFESLNILPFTKKLYQYNTQTGDYTDEITIDGTTNKTAAKTLNAGTKQEHQYKLVISFHYGNPKYADEIDYLQIKVKGEQRNPTE